MAKHVNNKKGFKVIRLSISEVLELWGKYGGTGICDMCNAKPNDYGYYVAVLNEFLCEKCYKSFINRTPHYEDDIPFEDRCFKDIKRKLELLKLWQS